ncbi:Sodium/hydrogen exchanger family-domain-containing protein [Xylariomycetidae sp. FL2044]|nr:Sodium/hydrogen exchanger family-domain-containing protein [Xylariomycetidae sp. FL2044]
MPQLAINETNTIIAILGTFIILYGLVSVKIKSVWYLGEALPAVAMGIILGPLAAKFIDPERWGSAEGPEQVAAITYPAMRIMIGIQLVIAGFQLPAKYLKTRFKEMLICLLPVMTLMWLLTSLCVFATIPNLTPLAILVIGSCVTPTDPILSQAVAKGPFADKYVPRALREAISAEAGENDGFAFPFLMLAVYLMRHAEIPADEIEKRSEEVGRLGGGVGVALLNWLLETWLYVVALGIVYGWVCGYVARKGAKFALYRRWIDSESYLLYPTALALFILGTGNSFGTNDILACFGAGCALNWDGQFLAETERRHDEVSSCIDVLLNFGGFMYVGAIIPWAEFNQPEHGITPGRLVALGVMVLLFRRIPAIFAFYKTMPEVTTNWKEALFMGYFGPIGVGAVFYVEHTHHLFPELEEADEGEAALLHALRPVVYFLVLFSIVVHGLSIPALNAAYEWYGVKPIKDDAVEIKRKSFHEAAPVNAVEGDADTFVAYNRFSRPIFNNVPTLPVSRDGTDSDANSMAAVLREEKREAQDFLQLRMQHPNQV